MNATYADWSASVYGPPNIMEPLSPSYKNLQRSIFTTSTILPSTNLTATATTAAANVSTILPTTSIFTNTITATTTTTTTTTLSTLGSIILNEVLKNFTVNSSEILNGSLKHANNTLNITYLKQKSGYSITSMVLLGVVAAVLSILTVAGNVMVMISFKIDKQLQTISNYFLFSLAIADFAIGLISIPLFAVSTIMGYWPLGPHICDTWLALDYLASNASVLNLLIISFDRYFSVTRPLTYRAKRTTNRAAVMIGAAWGISLLLWPPWIYSWPYIEGKRTVPPNECYIQFIETNQYITFGTAIAAFYFPVTIMCFLYYRIWRETKKRQKDLPNLQAGKKDSSKRSNSSDENQVVNHTAMLSVSHLAIEPDNWRRPRSESSADAESLYMTNMVTDTGYLGMHSRKSSIKSGNSLRKSNSCYGGVKEWCIAWWHSGREDSDHFPADQEEPSEICTSMNVMRDTLSIGGTSAQRAPGIMLPSISPTPNRPIMTPLAHLQDMPSSVSMPRDLRNAAGSIGTRSISQDSVYTILIRLPSDGTSTNNGPDAVPSIKMIHEDISGAAAPTTMPPRRTLPTRDSEYSLPLRRISQVGQDVRIPLNTKIISKQLGKAKQTTGRSATKKKKKSQEKRQESKAAKTLSAILLSFIITWTPYNILVLIKPLSNCTDCIPDELWDFFYALCYINSTINPVCYALCNASFRRTYIRILTCKWHTRSREGMVRGVYN